MADGTIESTFVQERIAEGGILIGYWDEDELETAIREEWHPRFAAHNPIVAPTLRKLLRRSGAEGGTATGEPAQQAEETT